MTSKRAIRWVLPLVVFGWMTGAHSAATSVATAATSPVCSTSYDTYSASAATLAACGDGTYDETSTSVLSDGGSSHHYELNGNAVWTNVPPAGFDAQTASSTERALYDIPAEPSADDPTGQALWEQMIANINFVSAPIALHSVPVSASNTTPNTSPNWSGYVNHGGGYTLAEATYIEPQLYPSGCPDGALVIWAGLGGWNVGELAQDGTAELVGGLGASQAWWEILPAQPYIVPVNLSATVGWNFVAETTHDTGNTFSFFMYNFQTKSSADFNETYNGFSGATAEYIAERPSGSSGPVPLANFETMHFTDAITNGQEPVGDFPNWQVTMINPDDNYTLAVPGALSGNDSFADVQHVCK